MRDAEPLREIRGYIPRVILRRDAIREPGEDIPGGEWKLTLIRRPAPGVLSAYLVSKSGQRYVVSYQDGRLAYMREYHPPSTIPKYVDNFIREKAEKQ